MLFIDQLVRSKATCSFKNLVVTMMSKERYRIGNKQKPWRSQIYIKLTRSNNDDSRKYPLKYFCLNVIFDEK